MSRSVLKNVTTYHHHLTHTFVKRPLLTDFKMYTHSPPPKETKIWRIGPEVKKTQGKCQNPPLWHILKLPERYVFLRLFVSPCFCLASLYVLGVEGREVDRATQAGMVMELAYESAPREYHT